MNSPRPTPAKLPPWLLFPIGLGLVRLSIYPGRFWWLLAAIAVVLDIITLVVLLRLTERYPLGRRRPFQNIGPYVATAIVFVATVVASQRAILTMDPATPADETILGSIVSEMFTFLVWTGVAHGIRYLRRFRAEEAHGLQLRLDLASAARKRAEAELRSFEAELNPKFLIGALRSAAQQTQSDAPRAERLLVEIGDAVRAARPVSRATTLGDEIAALAPFVALEQSRLNQEIALNSHVEGDLLDVPLPPVVLTALVREALRTTSGAGTIAIDINAALFGSSPDERVQVDVTCSHRQPTRSSAAAEDDVLARTAEHLRAALGVNATIDVSRSAGGVGLRLTVPIDGDGATASTSPLSDGGSLAAQAPQSGRAVPVLLTVAFIGLSALNIHTTLTRPRSNGLFAPTGWAILEGLHAAACITLILYVAIRMTRRGLGPRMWGLHAMTALGLGLVNSMTKWLFVTVAGHPYPPHTFGGIVGRTVGGMTMYGVLAGIMGAFEYARRHRSAEEKSLQLRAELVEAERRRVETELRALEAELNPHFLGNALAGAASLLQSDPTAAGNVLTQLADLVGTVVSRVGTQEVTLQEEIEGLAPFIAVEQSRFGDRLAVQWHVDEDARGARVPHMILQPLVENAVKHGLASRGGRIVVAGRRLGEHLELSVQDNGVGLEQARKTPQTRRGGVGLANSRARLEQLYGGAATLLLEPAALPESGTIVKVTLPWR